HPRQPSYSPQRSISSQSASSSPPPSVHGSGTYSHGVLTSAGLLFLSGQVAKNVKNQSIGLGDFEAQAIQIFENIRLILAEAGGSMADIVKINVYLTDGRYIDTYRAVRARYFSDPNPASTGVVVAGLASPEWLLEIEVVADLG
ncbi:MAG: RidA family protein, partial [Alphaproteobacteria bacterium]|nr:RidA family protein [Alphaproteobacteria bacterium]